MDIGSDQVTPQGRTLDSAPPQPPRQGRSLMSMASDNTPGDGGIDISNPAIAVMMQWGKTRQELLKLASKLPTLSSGIQQMISGFEAVIPQQVADIVSGNAAGSSGSGLGAGAPTPPPAAPPVQTGMP